MDERDPEWEAPQIDDDEEAEQIVDAASSLALPSLPEPEKRKIKAKYEEKCWSRVLSVQVRCMNPGFTVKLAADVIEWREEQAAVDPFPADDWKPLFDAAEFWN